jgi:hypothetical protein
MSPAADNPYDGGADTTRLVPMFSAPGHRDTIWSDVKVEVARSRQIAWEGGTAATHAIEKVSGAAEVRTRSLELHFSWNFGRAEADAQSGSSSAPIGTGRDTASSFPPGLASSSGSKKIRRTNS